MTRIDFYFEAPDKLLTAAKIAQKAFAQDCRLVVYAPVPSIADAFDRLLWTHPPTGFLPHVRADSPLAGETPVVICARMEDLPHHDVLINLAEAPPPEYARFARLIEIVGRDEDDKAPARERFRQYRAAGYEIARHDLSGQ